MSPYTKPLTIITTIGSLFVLSGCVIVPDQSRPHGSPGAAHAKAKISDLNGMNSIKAFDVMRSRHFTNVDTLTQGNTMYSIYYNAKTHQCVQLTNANNRVESADDIGTHPKCK